MSLCCVCCVLSVEFCASGWSLVQNSPMDICLLWVLCVSVRGLCEVLITFTEESYGCLSVLSVVCCEVLVCATGWSLVQRSPMDISLLWVLCIFKQMSVWRADHLYRWVLRTSFCCDCCVLCGRGLCDGLITHTELFYGYLSVVSVVCWPVEVCASGRSLVQKSPI